MSDRLHRPEYVLAPGDLLTTPAAAALLGCHSRTVQRLIVEDKLPAFRLGSGRTSYRIHADDLMTFVRENGHHDPRKVAASHPDTLAAFRPEPVDLVRHPRSDGLQVVKLLRLPAGIED